MAVRVAETTLRQKSTEQTSLATSVVQNQLDRRTRSFRVSDVDNESDALAASGIPEKGDTHPDDAQLVCRRLRASGVANAPRVYDIDAEYEFVGYALGTPLATLPQPGVTWTTQLVEEQTFFDINENPIQLPSGEALDTPPTRVYPVTVLQYEFSSLTFTANIVFTHAGRVNNATWNTATTGSVPAKCAMLRAVNASKQYGDDFNYWRVQYEIAFRDQIVEGQQRGWQLALLNAGFQWKFNGQLWNIKTSQGELTRVPVLLNSAGTQHALQTSVTKNFVYFDIYKGADFSLLGVL